MIPTPDTSCLLEDVFQDVYEPAEDTFALLDALEEDKDKLCKFAAEKLLFTAEIGCGSGCVSSFFKSGILQNRPTIHFMTDISNAACNAATNVVNKNRELYNDKSGILLTAQTYFLQGLRIKKSIDVLLFNPPYVPTEFEEIPKEANIASAWAGGTDGMDVTNQLLNNLSDILSADGVFYMVAVARNKPEKIQTYMLRYGYDSKEVLRRKAGRETLCVLRFSKNSALFV
ncbi:prorein methyltransferase Mtq2 [Schizosaccharomyces octosporus yFS286]|uniref:Prorein methyltransferase Mtq2 n=1 Tax=Schizosaccharomyces octosporus (strain yFS286) TaxID=483514 RepID=S9Q2C8_SCHOY|nr:prorein methyltransferase Mtq2 [Schizosaccharomyces octosporus yFS286]EPX73863.1 prorein methyltransferase Mtq2 [Schizosaccharomyces octosporus yFS286]